MGSFAAIDQRRRLLGAAPTGQWNLCHEHLDDALAARVPLYEEFLIPTGGRYVAGIHGAEPTGPPGAVERRLVEDLAPLIRGGGLALEPAGRGSRRGWPLSTGCAGPPSSWTLRGA